MTSALMDQCKALKLAHVPRLYADVPYHDREQYLHALFQAELDARQSRKAGQLVKQARFPILKRLDDFQWDPIILPSSATVTDLTDLTFLENHQNVLALGAVGTGKTHLAIALGVKVCMAGKAVRFYHCLDLVNELMDSHKQGRLSKMMKTLGKLDLLILDELGFVPLHRDGAELLFNVVASCYERASVIVTSNLQFSEWNTVLGDNRLTAALIDRLVHHAHILAFEGESYRLRQAFSNATSKPPEPQR